MIDERVKTHTFLLQPMSYETVVQTVKLNLETSQKKNEKVQKGIDEFLEMCGYLSHMMPTFPENEWHDKNNSMYNLLKKKYTAEGSDDAWDEAFVNTRVPLQVQEKVVGAYKSWSSNGKPGENPDFVDSLEESNYISIKASNVDIEENERGVGIKFRFIPYDPIWFHVKPNPFSEKYLDKLLDGDAENGSCELHLHEDGSLVAHQTVKWDVDVLEDEDAETAIGVDIGDKVLHAITGMDENGEVLDVEIRPGREVRHYRDRLKKKRKELQEQDDRRRVIKCKGEQERYTDQSLDTSSREIIDFALSFDRPKIVLEDLTDYRETAEDPLHDWPYGKHQEKIMYKAKAEGIPVEVVDARNTSAGCRKCGQVNQEYRDGRDFHCRRCGYEVHADVNAAMNLAQAGLEQKA